MGKKARNYVALFGLSYVYTKDLYLVITLNLINLHVKSTALFNFHCAVHLSLKSTMNFSLKKHCTFHWKALRFSLSTALFSEKHCAFHFPLLFSLKSSMHFTEKHCTFHFLLHFLLKSSCTFHFSLLHFSVKSTKTTDSTQISQFNLVFHRVQR